jgi:HK97 gp10 family phage protein
MARQLETTLDWHGEEVKIRGKRVVGLSAYETGLVVEGQAKELCPVDTGRLAGSITTQAVDKGTSPKLPATSEDLIKKPTEANEVLVGTPVEYGPYMEFGTIKTDAQPFLRPALDLAQGKVLTIVRDNARMQFREYLKETG